MRISARRFIYALAIRDAAFAINRVEISAISLCTSISELCFRPRITISDPVGKELRCDAIAWRICRDTRWRRTEPPTLFPIINPARAWSVEAGDM